MTIINPEKSIISSANLQKMFLEYDKIVFLAPNEMHEVLIMLNDFDIDAVAIDYDPKFSKVPFYINKDFVFDDVDLDVDLIVHKNVEKTYPIKMPKGVDVILIGDNDSHNGDCIPIHSCQQLIDLYKVSEIYDQGCDEKETHYIVYGKI